MKRFVQFELDEGGSVVVEVDEPTVGGAERVARADEVIKYTEGTLQSALDQIRPAADAVIAKLQSLSRQPEEIGVEFGIKLGAKAGAFLASADAEATFKVTLKWKGGA